MPIHQVIWRISRIAARILYHAAYLPGAPLNAARAKADISKKDLMGIRIRAGAWCSTRIGAFSAETRMEPAQG